MAGHNILTFMIKTKVAYFTGVVKVRPVPLVKFKLMPLGFRLHIIIETDTFIERHS